MKLDQNKNVCIGMFAFVPHLAIPGFRRARGPGFVALAAAALLGGCATPVEPSTEEPTIRHYSPPDAIVGTSNSGRFETSGGCIFFRFENRPDRRPPALFAPGTRLSSDRRSILLPGGRSISFGRRVTIAFEAPPNATGLDSTCGANPIQVLNTVEK